MGEILKSFPTHQKGVILSGSCALRPFMMTQGQVLTGDPAKVVWGHRGHQQVFADNLGLRRARDMKVVLMCLSRQYASTECHGLRWNAMDQGTFAAPQRGASTLFRVLFSGCGNTGHKGLNSVHESISFDRLGTHMRSAYSCTAYRARVRKCKVLENYLRSCFKLDVGRCGHDNFCGQMIRLYVTILILAVNRNRTAWEDKMR